MYSIFHITWISKYFFDYNILKAFFPCLVVEGNIPLYSVRAFVS